MRKTVEGWISSFLERIERVGIFESGSASRAMAMSSSLALRAVNVGLRGIEGRIPGLFLFAIKKSFLFCLRFCMKGEWATHFWFWLLAWEAATEV